jgi:predicted N-acetyltransferase YhbS
MTDNLKIRQARADDMHAIVRLIDGAREWLRGKGTGQWAEPWPTESARDARIARGIKRGSTWIVEANGAIAATITYRDKGNPKLWTANELSESAVYMPRLIVSRSQAGRGLGSALIDWVGLRGKEERGAKSTRIDVWSTSLPLHRYYKSQGFEHLRTFEFESPWEYPSAALFQKPVAAVEAASAVLFQSEVSLAAN